MNECQHLDEIARLRQKVDRLSNQLLTDELTGLYNQRQFKQSLQSEISRSKRNGTPTSLVVIDLDHFGRINENHGIEAGNAVLRHVADILVSEVRTTDIVCRYDDEQLAVIFPETHLNLAVNVADRIRTLIAFTPVQFDDGEINVTASMGASVYMKSSILDTDEFVESVDKYLDEAKESGRNCICHINYADLRAVTEVGFEERLLLSGFE